MFTAQRIQELRDTYLFVFDTFATDKSEVASQFGISGDAALSRLKRLEEFGLITRMSLTEIGMGMVMDSETQAKSMNGLFKELTWQSWHTYDDHTREQAESFFDEAFKDARS